MKTLETPFGLRKGFPLCALLVFLSGCATPQTKQAFQEDDRRLVARDGNISAEVLGVRGASEGWLEYRVRVQNVGSAPIYDIRGIVVDTSSREYKGATDVAQLEEPPALLEGSLFLGGAVAGTGILTLATGAFIPLLGPILFGGAAIAHGNRQRSWQEDLEYFIREAIAGKSVPVNDAIEGSLLFPSVEPQEIRVGYISRDRREWLVLRDSNPGPSTTGQNPNAGEPLKGAGADESPKDVNVRGKSDIRTAQRILGQLGFEPGTIDGQMGNITRAAIKEFQRSRSLTVNGLLDEPTWQALVDAEK